MQQIQSPVTRRVLGPMLAGASLGMELEPGFPPVEPAPVPEIQPPAQEVEVPLDREFVALLRANLHAAAQHVALGHEGPTFRECSRPACIDAAMLVPQLDEVELGATDAELEAILDRVLAALEESLPEAPVARVRIPRGGTSWSGAMAE